MTEAERDRGHHVCPFWVGYVLASPLRGVLQNPREILGPHVRPGMRVMDVGCAMGFFSLPLARLVGDQGRAICLDVQRKMLDALLRRARRAGLAARIEARLAAPDTLGVADLAASIDFGLAFGVVHEVPDRARFFSELLAVLKPGGRVLVAEPRGRVSARSFRDSIARAESAGFRVVIHPRVCRSRAVLLEQHAGP